MNGFTFLICMGSLYTVLHGTQAQDINDCSPNPCQNGARCTDGVNDYTCSCLTGYTGKNCQTSCGGNISSTSGTIVSKNYPNNYPNNTVCEWLITVEDRHTVELTFTDFDVEANRYCDYDYVAVYDGANQYGTELMMFCGYTLPSPVKYRSNGNQMYIRMRTDSSISARGFKADFVADIDYCSPNPCRNGGGCTDGVNDYTCNCATGYTGKNCTTNINECKPNPCQNGGGCTDGVNDYTCTCAAGYTGKNCQTNINECNPNPCQNSVACTDGVNDYTCTCAAGYTDKSCQTNINECNPNPCQNGGGCTDGINDYTCTCAAGYTGKNCTTNINECSPNPCENGGGCTDGVNDYTCTCVTGYTDKNCQTNINDCSPNPCLNGGTCTDRLNDFTCACNTGFSSQRCDKAALGASCSVQGTTCEKANSFCGSGSICLCTSSYYDNDGTNNIGGTCTSKVVVGEICPSPTAAVPKTATCLDSAASCEQDGTTYRCTCPSSHYDDNGVSGYGGNCVGKKQLGDVCPRTNAIGESASCNDSNARCLLNGGSYRCQCIADTYDRDGTSNIGGTCLSKVELGTTGCSTIVTNSCKSQNAQCQTNGGYCTCYSDFYDTNGGAGGGTCTQKIDLGQTGCSSSVTDSCKDGNAECLVNAGTCTCKTGYYDDNGSTWKGTCRKKKELGESGCSTVVANSCKDAKSRCNTNGGYCTCITGYFDSNGDDARGTCESNKGLGKPCTGQSNECSDSAAQCLDDKCTCGVNYYDSDGFTDGGNCISVSELKVLAISFPSNSIGTSQFEVSWTHPTADKLAQISSFVVDWRLKTSDNSLAGGNKEVSRTATSTMINTGITTGKTYIVTVTSKNAWTQSNAPRTTSLSKEQAAKPDIPRSLITPDLNANDGTISIGWSAPTSGVTSGYRVRLLDGTNELTSLERSSSPVSISNSNIKNGYRYKIEIKARSEAYDGTKYVWSDTYEEQIKTVVQVPSAPRSVVCDAIKDESVTLMWIAPEFPNGDLVKYIIQVLNANQQPQFNTSTSQVVESHTVISLSPGTTYMFRVFTENEMYTSTSYGQSNFCTTKAKLSDPPTDLKTAAVSSRNFTVSWNEPLNTYSEENYGYVFQLRNGDDCVKEVVYKCSNCLGTFQASSLENMCVSTVRDVISKTETELSGLQSYQFINMLPDTTYTVSGTAVNNLGRGNVVNISQTTAEEAPQTPYNVEVRDIGNISFTVSWSIDGPRPGQTNFTVSLTADRPAPNKEVTLTDFNLRSYIAEDLEEYWNYSVAVTATTSVGAKTSDITQEYRTKPAAPGNVVDLKVTWALGGIYTLMQISWRAPTILSRNSVIKEYSLVTSSSGKTPKKQSLSHESDENHEYTVVLNVIPEETYNFQVYATNVQDMKGAVTTVEEQAPAGDVNNAAVECDCYVQSIVVGGVLGLLILILLVYAGCVTVLNRRYRQNGGQEINAARKNDRKSHTYVNESFLVGVADVGGSTNPETLSDVASGGESDTEYSTLDENTREDKTIYDIIKPSRR